MIHPTADVSHKASIGDGTSIWHQAQVRDDATIGRQCILGKGVYVDKGVVVGDRVKIQNYASLFHGTIVEDGAFLGPYCCLTNDKRPRAITPSGELQRDADWDEAGVKVSEGASIGAGAVILPGVTVGRFAMVGAGAVVTKDVPAHGLAMGNPATLAGYVCRCGQRLVTQSSGLECLSCGETYHGLEVGQ